MKLYKIRDWAALFENNRSRTVANLSWVPIPNRHDGENFSMIMAHKNGAEIFAAWVLILQVASRCQPRGTLLRDNQKPHSPASLAIKTRAPEKWFTIGLDFLENQTDWLEIESNCQADASQVTPSRQAGDEEQKERTEQKGTGRKATSLEELKLCCAKTGVAESDALYLWNKWEANGWTNSGKPIRSWQHTIASWKAAGYLPSQKNGGKISPAMRPSGGHF